MHDYLHTAINVSVCQRLHHIQLETISRNEFVPCSLCVSSVDSSFTLTCGRSRFFHSSMVRPWIHALGCRRDSQLNYDKHSVNDCLDAGILQLILYSHCHSHRQVSSVNRLGLIMYGTCCQHSYGARSLDQVTSC